MVSGSLSAVAQVLSDQSVDKAALKARARALVLMGRIFQSYAIANRSAGTLVSLWRSL